MRKPLDMISYKYALVFGLLVLACGGQPTSSASKPSPIVFEPNASWKEYWFSGQAEISSYAIQQARYGEIREGEAVLVFVTEPFSSSTLTKADRPSSKNFTVLKCNATKRFNTGIYPYTLMTSSFTPLNDLMRSPKITHGMQEWCGQVFMEYQRRNNGLSVHSYFEGENASHEVGDSYFENDLWASIRMDPKQIPTGTLKMVPDLGFLRFRHIEPKAYDCEIALMMEEIGTLLVHYPALQRQIRIAFEKEFPYTILAWEETYPSGFGTNAKTMTSTGKHLQTIRLDYWNKNANRDEILRDSLRLRY